MTLASSKTQIARRAAGGPRGPRRLVPRLDRVGWLCGVSLLFAFAKGAPMPTSGRTLQRCQQARTRSASSRRPPPAIRPPHSAAAAAEGVAASRLGRRAPPTSSRGFVAELGRTRGGLRLRRDGFADRSAWPAGGWIARFRAHRRGFFANAGNGRGARAASPRGAGGLAVRSSRSTSWASPTPCARRSRR